MRLPLFGIRLSCFSSFLLIPLVALVDFMNSLGRDHMQAVERQPQVSRVL